MDRIDICVIQAKWEQQDLFRQPEFGVAQYWRNNFQIIFFCTCSYNELKEA